MFKLTLAVALLMTTATCCKKHEDRTPKIIQGEPYGQCVLPLLVTKIEEFSPEPVGLQGCQTELDGSACCVYGPRADGCVLLVCRGNCNAPWEPVKDLCP